MAAAPPDLHTESLAFPLDDLQALSSTQLALVQFHPQASDRQQEEARVLFFLRREKWHEERKRAVRLEEVPELAARAPKFEAEDDVEVEVAPPPEPPVEAKETARADVLMREVQQISLLDDDDDDDDDDDSDLRIVSSGPAVKKRKSETTVSSPRAAKAPKRAAGAARPHVLTPGEVADKLKKMGSFRRKVTPPVVPAEHGAPSASSSEAALAPLASASVASTSTPPPQPDAPRPALVTVLSADFLYKHTTAAALAHDAVPRPLALPAFAPNTNIGSVPRGIEAAIQAGVEPTADDPDQPFYFHPPPPFPVFTPAPFTVGDPPDKLVDPNLARQLYTVKVTGLSARVTPRLLLAFMLRNQHRMRPRPLAVRKCDEVVTALHDVEDSLWEDYGDACFKADFATFYLAFKSLEDAQLTISGNNGKKLPDLEPQPRQVVAELVRDVVPPDAPRDAHVASLDKELAVGWRWTECSDEVRREWRVHFALPRARVCPRFENPTTEECAINDEYTHELERIGVELDQKNAVKSATMADKRVALEAIKRVLYDERKRAWLEWHRLDEAERPVIKPVWPAWPDDAATRTRRAAIVDEIEEAQLSASRQSSAGNTAKGINLFSLLHERVTNLKVLGMRDKPAEPAAPRTPVVFAFGSTSTTGAPPETPRHNPLLQAPSVAQPAQPRPAAVAATPPTVVAPPPVTPPRTISLSTPMAPAPTAFAKASALFMPKRPPQPRQSAPAVPVVASPSEVDAEDANPFALPLS